MVKKEVFIKWGRGKRRYSVELKDYEKVGKVGRYNLYGKKKKEKKVIRGEVGRRVLTTRLKKGYKPSKRVVKKRKDKIEKINKVFQKKINKIIIPDILDIPINQVNLQYKSLLKGVMNKKNLGDLVSNDVLEVMIKQENINKIKWRMETRAEIYDRDGTKVAELLKGSGGDLMTLKEKMNRGVWRGAYIDYDLDLGEGYKFKHINKGNVSRVRVTVVFRG